MNSNHISDDCEFDMSPVTDEELERRFGITSEQLEEYEEVFARGELPSEPLPLKRRGRPLKFGEEMQFVGFKEPQATISNMDLRASDLGMSRSDYLRHLVEQDLRAAGYK